MDYFKFLFGCLVATLKFKITIIHWVEVYEATFAPNVYIVSVYHTRAQT